jgi:hypothetical protein
MLPEISELRTIAFENETSVISFSETWQNHSVTDVKIWIENYCIVSLDQE